jgi:hypothetical protein
MPPKKKRKSESQEASPDEEEEGAVKGSWLKSAARLRLLDDLEEGVLTLDAKKMPAKEAWDVCYKDEPEFKLVEYEQFRDRLNDHRKQVRDKKKRSAVDEEAFQRDRTLHPRSNHNSRGEPVFDLSDAKELLRVDVREGKNDGITSGQFQASRPEYSIFHKTKFKEHIYQEIRRNKFIYFLEEKREKDRATTW